jgi:hypothetical protein
MMYCFDYLGGAKFERGLIAREHPAGWGFGCFGTGVFGDSRRFAREVFDTGRVPGFRLQAMWSDNNHVYDSGFFKALPGELRKWRIFEPYSKYAAICVSPFCEHNLSAKMAAEAMKIVRQELPWATPVNSVWRGALLDNEINEVHGSANAPTKGRYFFSYDGSSAFDENVEADKIKHARAEWFFWWINQFNGNRNGNPDERKPRPQRKHFPKGPLGSNLIDACVYLKNSKGATKIPKRWTIKSVSDQAETPNTRDCKLVILAPREVGLIQLRTSNGQVIAQSRRGDISRDDPSRALFRFPEFGYLIAEKSRRISGSPVCNLVADGKAVGMCNPAFRDGDYR